MSRSSHRKRKKRRPRRYPLLSTGGLRRAMDLMDRYDGFDYEAGIFRPSGRPAPPRGWEPTPEQRAADERPGCLAWLAGVWRWR